MNPETRNPPELNPSANTAPTAQQPASEDLSFYRVPAPPIPGKTAWSLSPWLPE